MEDVGSARWGNAVLERVAARSAQQMSAENFPVALRILPGRIRSDLAQVYAFARCVDDIGDEAPGDRGGLLDAVEAEIRELPAGRATFGPVAALSPAFAEHQIPVETLLSLVEANRRDQTVCSYETFEDLLAYCRLSAAPVGRIVLHLADAADAANIGDSDAVCAALQVLEHCQDVGEDARAGRVYLPARDLRAAGVGDGELRGAQTSAPLRSVIALEVHRARMLLGAGTPLVARLRGWARLAVAGYVAGGLATADALAAADGDVLGQEIRPSRARTAMHAGRLLARTRRPR